MEISTGKRSRDRKASQSKGKRRSGMETSLEFSNIFSNFNR